MNRSILLLTLLLCGCNRGEADDAKASPDAKTAGGTATTAKQPVFPEPQAVQVLRVFDSTRIATALIVRGRSQNDNILEYARVMLADHGAITHVLDSLLAASGQSAADNTMTQQLRTTGQELVTRLETTDTGFNNAYLRSEIDHHNRALQLLDSAVIPSARTTALKDAIQQLRPAYEAHLQRAQVILQGRLAVAARPAAPAPAPAPVPVDTVRVDTLRIPRKNPLP